MSIAHLEMIIRNRKGAHELQHFVRYEVLERAVAEFKEKTNASTMKRPVCAHCDLFVEEHQIREVPAPYLSMEQARIDRLNAADDAARGML